MNVKTLSDSPQKLNDCIMLIEQSFNYDEDESFKEDFSPLVDHLNHENCYFLEDNGDVVATLFTLPRILTYKDEKIPVLFLGGISVSDEKRGAGLFRTLLETILLLNPHYVLYFLWSDLAQLYEKFNFYEFGIIKEIDCTNESKQDIKAFESDHTTTIVKDYLELKNSYLVPHREEHHWHLLLQNKSVDILEDENQNIYLVNKGMDLENICHEFHPQSAPLIPGYKNWRLPTQEPTDKEGILRYMGFLRLGNLEGLNNLIQKTSNGRLSIIEKENDLIKVNFDGEVYELGERDFIQGLWGPGKVEEWEGLVPDILVPGFDSI